MINYSNDLLRGLSGDDWVCDGIVTAAAFQLKFEPQFMKNECVAHSICWEDDTLVVDLMMKQKKTNDPEIVQYKAGIARYSRESIDRIIKSPAFMGILSYDREPLEGNPYHGNLLTKRTLSNTQKKLLPGVIATQFSEIISRK